MRSYKDSLLEYLEEQQFATLTKEWCGYLTQSFSLNPTNFQVLLSYPPIESQAALEECYNQISSPNLADVYYFISSNRIDETSTKLIHRIESVEDRLLCKYGIKDIKGWIEFKHQQKKENKAFNYLECLQNWLENQDSETVQLNLSKESKSRIDYINKYYSNLYNGSPSMVKTQEENVNLPATITVDFTSEANEGSATPFWTDQVIEEGFPFFLSDEDLSDINQSARLSSIRISGEIKGFQKLEVEPQNTSDIELFKAVLIDYKSELRGAFEHDELNDLKDLLSHTMEAFYSMSEFDLTLEIDNHFSEEDVELLRQVNFSCFPFFFSSKVEHYKWIELTEDNKLKIRIQSKMPQNIIVGAQIKKLDE